MRLLHTSDWHLGRGLHGVDLHAAQAEVCRRIVEVAQRERVDAVLVAGDVYDRSVPPVESVRLLGDTLSELCRSVPVVVTPGNHDSATRLGFAARLFQERLSIRNEIAGVANPVVLRDADGDVVVYALPYLDPERARRELPGVDDPPPRTHEAVVGRAMELVRTDLRARGNPRSVVVAHAFVIGRGGRDAALHCESERDITVGTLDNLPGEVFDGVNYVALGHLHGQQTLTPTPSGTVLRYCGSPLRFSFSEASHDKGVTIVDIDGCGRVLTRHVALPQPRGMARLTGAFAELIDPHGPFREHRSDWVAITVTDPARPDEMVTRLRSQYPHALVLRHDPAARQDAGGTLPVAGSADPPQQVLSAFLQDVGGVPPTPDELALLERAIADVFGAAG